MNNIWNIYCDKFYFKLICCVGVLLRYFVYRFNGDWVMLIFLFYLGYFKWKSWVVSISVFLYGL